MATAKDELDESMNRAFLASTRQREHKERMVEYLGELLIPVTEGFDHINLDMTFTYLGNFELQRVEDLSNTINLCHIYNLKVSKYLARGQLASLLNSRRSRNAKSMDMFTTMTSKSEQKFEDATETKKHGFSLFKFGKREQPT